MNDAGAQDRRAGRRVRLKDVAERAGVAVNTASTILNRRPNSWASEATIGRVFAAAEELGYRPNRAAVALQRGRFESIGLLVADLTNPYFTHVATVLGEVVERKGFELVIESWRNDLEREKRLLDEFADRNVDGLMVFVSDIDIHREFLGRQAAGGIPVVALAMPGAGEVAVDLVMPNFESGLREAALRLYGDGHRRFAFVAARSPGQRVGKRPALFEEIVASLPGASLRVCSCGPTLDAARGVAGELLGLEERPTAMVALNDFTAIGVMRAAVECGLRVPEDVSVVGIDGIPLGGQLMVSLSTVVQPHAAMIERAFDFLWTRMEGYDGEPRRAEFAACFEARESSGPAPLT
ncbi:MAG: LacI family transcriptional regulator [Akkermansiaceae bacterium]|jgi:LacI family transcriptional regulator|nr:LacI family transcriptional regulator [Akkermansiaceae bacterium]